MGDNLPDVAYELKRFELQRKGIEITMLDQRAQLADFVDERLSCKTRIKELRGLSVPSLTEDEEAELSAGDKLRRQKAALEAERDVLSVEARMAEIDMLESRYQANITASEEALETLDAQMTSMKEARANG